MYDYVFWDWNGTLFDDAYATCESVNTMLKKRGISPISLESYRELIEVPIINFYKKVMDVSKETMETLSEEFHFHWAEHLTENPLSENAGMVLESLAKLEIKQYIFSSSKNELIEPFLEKFGICKYFEKVLGAPDCYVGSKIERTCDFIEKNNIDKSKILFVGDMVHDFEVASAIGGDCVLVCHGHQSKKSLEETGSKVVSSLGELLEFIETKITPRGNL